ncbi:phosphomannomutase/phosphoglucomutase [Helcobacillus massiliensis]|uniref:Phosphomannomutase n=1 Tax=Helcobacillus massiliensis TaxID=521392 RepID=A0A839QT96_9MICO|nr:phosphomannomutase/phosphoglucomutase [Helcobacillus massiliensis]MCG7426875.1 phosphomannomutase/phosphoglucomutase [Helcobacillus sp. ACRRO]MBB3021980.1 phosphomannomutase [Helcobacillus massiliensis]MCT1557463.1 phosphomannomutase/phosphoglucomutase [Helcobacillus massiliensis]MCT2036356.1 phosphomannomutase/phosphoglucomutase [Helcobacillus massiliensis]MCT2331902.1 phosphomannomutase/phosphoglucomutase [Helcobacillus massiliensis]
MTTVSTPIDRSGTDLSRIVKAYDVRGRAHEDFTADGSRALGAAFADLLDGADIIVSHDMRESSPELAGAFADGARTRGSTVLWASLSSTDQLYCASGLRDVAGAQFTASHNPGPDNGIKMCFAGAVPVGRDTGLTEIRDTAQAYLDAGTIPAARRRGEQREIDTLGDYIDTVLSLVPLDGERELTVVVDAGNAMAGLTVPALAQRVPSLRVVPLFFELDGTFPNHEANPLDYSTLSDLRAAVKREGADLGLAFDGDADRCIVVDESGEVVSPSAITAMIATGEIRRVRAEGETSPAVVANIVSSRHVRDAIEAEGGRWVVSRVGHSIIKALMAKENAVFGGEHSAHYYFRDFFFADSGMLAALHTLRALQKSSGTLSDLMAEHDPFAASGEINSRVADADGAAQRVRSAIEGVPGVTIDDLDGMTVTHWDEAMPEDQRWWFSLRPSNTEPLLRLNVEAATGNTMARVRDEILGIIRADAPAGRRRSDSAGPVGRPDGAAHPAARSRIPSLPAWAADVVRCPACRSDLVQHGAHITCSACSLAYRDVEGLPMLIQQR